MKLISVRSLFIVSVLVASQFAHSYSQPTHIILTEKAAENSKATDIEFLKRFGFSDLSGAPYTLIDTDGGRHQSLLSLVKTGAYLEDAGIRALNHFYAPQSGGMPLTYFGIEAGRSSLNAIAQGKSSDSYDRSIYEGYLAFESAIIKSALRDKHPASEEWSRVFQYLGHYVHHMQDMHQPQHVRNDDHCDAIVCQGALNQPSIYEYETNDLRSNLPLSGYPVVSYNRPTDYWWGVGYQGAASFTSFNFISAGTNFEIDRGYIVSNALHSSPHASDLTRHWVDVKMLFPSSSIEGEILYLGNFYTDPYTGEEITNERLAAISSFSAPYQEVVTTNFETRRRAREILLPRAVGFSSGLIDFFFRGKIEIVGIEYGDESVVYTLKNLSENNGFIYDITGAFELGFNFAEVGAFIEDDIGNPVQVGSLRLDKDEIWAYGDARVLEIPLENLPLHDEEPTSVSIVYSGGLVEPGESIPYIGSTGIKSVLPPRYLITEVISNRYFNVSGDLVSDDQEGGASFQARHRIHVGKYTGSSSYEDLNSQYADTKIFPFLSDDHMTELRSGSVDRNKVEGYNDTFNRYYLVFWKDYQNYIPPQPMGDPVQSDSDTTLTVKNGREYINCTGPSQSTGPCDDTLQNTEWDYRSELVSSSLEKGDDFPSNLFSDYGVPSASGDEGAVANYTVGHREFMVSAAIDGDDSIPFLLNAVIVSEPLLEYHNENVNLY